MSSLAPSRALIPIDETHRLLIAAALELGEGRLLRVLALMARDYGIGDWDRQRIRRRLAPESQVEGDIDRRPARDRRADGERRQLVLEYLEALNRVAPRYARTFVIPRCW